MAAPSPQVPGERGYCIAGQFDQERRGSCAQWQAVHEVRQGDGRVSISPLADVMASLIRSLIQLRPETFGAHHAQRTTQVTYPPDPR